MGRIRDLVLCVVLLLVLVLKHEVQAETPCDRQCPVLCGKKGKSAFQCYLYCIQHCNSKKGDTKGAKLTKEEEQQLKSDNEAMLSKIEEQLIKTPQHELEGHDEDEHKSKSFLGKQGKKLKGQDHKKKAEESKKKGKEIKKTN